MTAIDSSNALSNMLDKAFTRFDRNHDEKLDADEFQSFYEILKPGIAMGQDNKPRISEQDYLGRMDADSDGAVSRAEAQNAQVLMPASLGDDSLNPMLQYLLAQTTESARIAAAILAGNDGAAARTDTKA